MTDHRGDSAASGTHSDDSGSTHLADSAAAVEAKSDGATESELESDGPMIVHPDEADREFDWRGWSLVAAVFVAFLVVPGLIYLYPRVPSTFGLTFWDAYLVLPMIPAVILGLLAVWATTRP